MILGSAISSFFFSKWKYRDKWKKEGLKVFLMSIILTFIVGEILSRFVLEHKILFPILMLQNRSFCLKYYCVLFAVAMLTPVGLYYLTKVFKMISSKVLMLIEKIPIEADIIHSRRKENIIIFLIAIVLFGGILMGTRVVWSGYHFMDDHCVIEIQEKFEGGESLINVIKEEVKGDLTIRFRPLYWTVWVIKIYLFGTNFTAYMIIAMIEGIFTFVLLYKFARNIKATQIEALIFVLLSVLGEQFAPWFRPPNQENEGFLYCAIVMFLISKIYADGVKGKIAQKMLLCLMILISSLQKEAFTIMLPGYLMLIMAVMRINGCRKEFIGLLKREIGTIIFTLVVFLNDVYAIVFKVGTNQIGYAGFSKSTPITEYLEGLWISLSEDLKFNTIFFVISIAVIICMLIIRKIKVSELARDYEWLLIAAVYILVSQLVLHAKSSMFDRYIIPYIVGWVFLCVLFSFNRMRDNRFLYGLYFILSMALIFICLVDSIIISKDWAVRGEDINALLNELKSELDCCNDADILVNIRAPEEEMSVVMWEEYYTYRGWNWTKAETRIQSNDLNDITPHDYDYIVSHLANYYNTEMLQDYFYINRNDYNEIYRIRDEYVILKHN